MGEHEAIVEKERYDSIQECFAEHQKKGWRYSKNYNYLLAGIITCSKCGSPMTTASVRRNGKEYRYYRCNLIKHKWT